MLVRVEIPVDAPGIDSLLRRAFPTGAQADLVHQLREDGQLTLGIVATDDEGGVVGYAAFSPVTVDGEDRQWVALAPLAVDEARRRQGLGEQLVYEGLDALNEFGYTAVVVLGDAGYYARFGFVPAAGPRPYCQWPTGDAAFLVYPLDENAFDGDGGVVEYAAPFNRC